MVRLHRWAGLGMAIFLIIAGLTGSVIAFYHELDEALNPELFLVDEESGATQAPMAIAERLEKENPEFRISSVPFELEPGHSLEFGVDPNFNPATGKLYDLGYDQIFVNPYSGEIIGKRDWGECCLERRNLLPFLYKMHYSLHLPDRWGWWFMGIVAFVWIFDCFVGAWLTFPNDRPLISKWKPAWKLKRNAGPYRVNFDLHRAGGLWFWGVLLMLSVSGLYLNLGKEVFKPIVSIFSSYTATPFDLREPRPVEDPIVPKRSFREIIPVAEREAQERGWDMPAGGAFYSDSIGVYVVRFGPDHPSGLGRGTNHLYFDGIDGKALGARIPGEGTTGDLFMQIQFPLHTGQIAGLPGRILISITGLVVALLSLTGIVIWWKKRLPRTRPGVKLTSARLETRDSSS
ncbi:MAG: PepSY domain-containing protein [Candidatus Nitrohelix vancouverensis]|uniref:PepSY domain-containing protein n=1 Tax=Candidatus Nitrohelix vancouverensis TaxID=2705534 RepID=A0A7T0C547_9BACT|nr:MAG: PepSY domain-containing protein [Candidatus Nitrohelix vancouverensis]